MHSFLFPTYQELIKLEKNGMLVKFSSGEQKLLTASLVVAIGDIPACADLCGHIGHQAYFGCRICRTEAIRVKASMCYPFPQGGISTELIRKPEDFIQGDEVSFFRVFFLKKKH